MTTVNNRVKQPQAMVINGVDAGGAMTARITEGFENIMKSAPDGMQVPVIDREVQFCRGSIVSQDWVHFIDLLTGAVGTYVFYERKSGVAAATGYIKHTITNPVIHNIRLTVTKGGYAVIAFDFECKAADVDKGVLDMHVLADTQAAPTYISAARGGYRVESAIHGADAIYHVTGFEFGIAMNLVRACNDGDVGYTCVDAEIENMACGGSITFQDADITAVTFEQRVQDLVLASAADLVLVLTQGQGAADKTITIANVLFGTATSNSDVNADFTTYTAPFDVANDVGTPLTLEGTDKIITIA